MIVGMNTLAEGGLRGLGLPGAALAAELCGLAVTIISLALMLRPLGIVGAAIASLLGYSATFAVAMYKGVRATGLSFVTLACPRVAELAATAKSLCEIPVRILRARRGVATAS
jgi:Na+-driven multidrug efflux pump